MNLVDIASWQAGINLDTLFRRNAKLNGVIVKVSQGTGYTNPYAAGWLDWLVSTGKIAGTYHYLDLSGAKEEARYYAETVKPWLGKAVLAIDYEDTTLAKGTGYLKECLDEVYRLTGVKPLVYCSQSVTQSQDFSAIASAGYKLWVAQYADMKNIYGFLSQPWQQGSVAPFNGYVMHQYTSCGRLEGWDKNLDFDLYPGTAADWAALAKTGAAPDTPTELKGPDRVVVADVLAGRYGIGSERTQRLRADGYDPDKVQAKINELYNIAYKIKPLVDGNMEYLNSIIKIVRSV